MVDARKGPIPPSAVQDFALTRRGLDLQGKRVLVVGLGVSGRAAALLCHRRGAAVTLTDNKTAAQLADRLADLPADVQLELGGHRVESFRTADLIVLSPGVPDLAEVQAAREAGVRITGELELAGGFIGATIVAITGTNGKSTTTALCGSMMASTGWPTFVGGNLGEPLSLAVDTPAGLPGGVCVCEVSSYQAETIETFHPQVAVLLNITPDHLDRYQSMDAYVAAKARMFSTQRAGDFAVMNLDDPLVAEVTRRVRSHWVPISTQQILTEGGWLEGDVLCVRIPGGEVERYPLENPRMVGRHNQENALAALVSARLLGALPAEVRRGLLSFRGLSHRMQLVAQAGGVHYYNDSKATNVGAAVAALTGFPRPVVLIAGGRDKGASYQPLCEAMKRVGRAVVVLGEAADRLEASLASVVPVVRATSMRDAVRMAATRAEAGDAVVLSPACSSFDMFRDYQERGDVFRTCAHELESEAEEDGSEPYTPGVDHE